MTRALWICSVATMVACGASSDNRNGASDAGTTAGSTTSGATTSGTTSGATTAGTTSGATTAGTTSGATTAGTTSGATTAGTTSGGTGGKLGAACAATTDCSEGTSPACLSQQQAGVAGGYCSSACDKTSGAGCPSDGYCIKSSGICLRICNANADCERTDVVCQNGTATGTGPGACGPKCTTNTNCSSDGTVTCDMASGKCIPAPAPTGNQKEGQSCSQTSGCIAGETCTHIVQGAASGYCSPACTAQGGCATFSDVQGQCAVTSQGATTPTACIYICTNGTTNCQTGTTCQQLAKPNDAYWACLP